MRVSEIYPAILGESEWAGMPGLILRLAGCNLACAWCDTQFAQQGGEEWPVEKILAAVRRARRRRVLVTGGEPLCQPETPALLAALAAAGHPVMLETNGSQDLAAVPPAVHVVMDLKPPSSRMSRHNRLANLDLLKPGDEIKIIVAHRRDYLWARKIISRHSLAERFPVTLSPAFRLLDPAQLAGWMLADRLEVRLGLQLHKYIFGDRRGT